MADSLYISLIGCGKMGSALLQGWIDSGVPARFSVMDPGGLPERFADSDNVHFANTALACAEDLQKAAVVVLAIKPQMLDSICHMLSATINQQALVLSIAAGKTLDTIEGFFESSHPVVRAMPNTPAAIGKGISVMVANEAAQAPHRTLAEKLMQVCGPFEWLEDEKLMDVVTAVSGSGPAYVFHLIEVMAKAGEQAGLEKEMARRLARQTIIGSAALAEAEPNTAAENLRQNVTSPGGTTEAALKVLMDGRWQALMNEAVQAAVKRGQDLS